MLNDVSIVFLGLWILVAGLFSYSSYWAFTIRKALVHHLYRRQALWAGQMALYFVALTTFLTFALTYNVNVLSVNILGGLLIAFGFIVLFLWIDSTIGVARRSDPLYRDSLRWSRLRYLWAVVTFFGAIGAVFDSINSGFATAAPFGGILFFGAIALLLSASRSGDPTLKTHLKWTGLCIFLLWLSSQLVDPLSRFVSEADLVQAITFSLVAVGAYSLYRSARSLAPIGRFPPIALSHLQQRSGNSVTASEEPSPPC